VEFDGALILAVAVWIFLCRLREAGVENAFVQISQIKSFYTLNNVSTTAKEENRLQLNSPVSNPKKKTKMSKDHVCEFVINTVEQGFSPVWMRMCILICRLEVNCLSQLSQA
jgi:hypothetical protein